MNLLTLRRWISVWNTSARFLKKQNWLKMILLLSLRGETRPRQQRNKSWTKTWCSQSKVCVSTDFYYLAPVEQLDHLRSWMMQLLLSMRNSGEKVIMLITYAIQMNLRNSPTYWKARWQRRKREWQSQPYDLKC